MRTNVPSARMLFRADASPEIGVGHVMRCLTLADAARTQFGFETAFFMSEQTLNCLPQLARSAHDVIVLSPAELSTPKAQALALGTWADQACGWVVVDHYGLDVEFERACRDFASSILVLDDLADRQHDCDVVLDQTLGRQDDDYRALVPKYARLLLGPHYAVLRPQFLNAREHSLSRRDSQSSLKTIFVNFGGTIEMSRVGGVLEAISQAAPDVDVDVVVGASACDLSTWQDMGAAFPMTTRFHCDVDDMAALMARADLAIGAAGTSSWERCALGVPSLIFVLANNQILNSEVLARAGAGVCLGTWDGHSIEKLAQELKALKGDAERLATLSQAARKVCDARGSERALVRLAGAGADQDIKLNLRSLEADDLDIMFAWQTDPQTRVHSRNPDIPTYEEHKAWFASRMNSSVGRTFVVESEGIPCGVLRLDPWEHSENWEVSIVIAPQSRGQGVASQAMDLLMQAVPGLCLVAEVAPENTPSLKLFEGHGFVATATPNIYRHEPDA